MTILRRATAIGRRRGAGGAIDRERRIAHKLVGALTIASVCVVGGQAVADVDVARESVVDAPVVVAQHERLIDTRTSTRLGAERVLRVPVPVVDATTAFVSIIAVRPVANGHLTVFDCAAGPAGTSTLNYLADDVMSNTAAVGITDGEICVTSLVETDVVVDLFATDRVSRTHRPRRVVDTRTDLGAGQVSDTSVNLSPEVFGGLAVGTPVLLNVTAASVVRPGHLTLEQDCRPTNTDTSTVLNFAPGRAVANFVITTVGSCISGLRWGGEKATDIVIDYAGTTEPHLMIDALIFPYRFWDTRAPRSERLTANRPIVLSPFGFARQTPMGNFSALSILNVQAIQPDYSGYLTVYGCDRATDPIPTSSTTNMVAGVTRAQTVLVDTSQHSQICAVASGAVDLVIDFLGGLEQPSGLGVRHDTCFGPIQRAASLVPMDISKSVALQLVGPAGTYRIHLTGTDGVALQVDDRTIEIDVDTPDATGRLAITGPSGATMTAEIEPSSNPSVC